jgi:SpoVK/Ycf46/Vps4 family AAA+-type ATPase
MLKKTGISLASVEAEKCFLENSAGLSGADIEAVLTRARMKSVLEKDTAIDAEDVKSALEDFIPPSYPTEIEMQNLAAVLECTSRSLLPEKYRAMDRGEIARRAKELALLSRD